MTKVQLVKWLEAKQADAIAEIQRQYTAAHHAKEPKYQAGRNP